MGREKQFIERECQGNTEWKILWGKNKYKDMHSEELSLEEQYRNKDAFFILGIKDLGKYVCSFIGRKMYLKQDAMQQIIFTSLYIRQTEI